jgi:hypothetical protein
MANSKLEVESIAFKFKLAAMCEKIQKKSKAHMPYDIAYELLWTFKFLVYKHRIISFACEFASPKKLQVKRRSLSNSFDGFGLLKRRKKKRLGQGVIRED